MARRRPQQSAGAASDETGPATRRSEFLPAAVPGLSVKPASASARPAANRFPASVRRVVSVVLNNRNSLRGLQEGEPLSGGSIVGTAFQKYRLLIDGGIIRLRNPPDCSVLIWPGFDLSQRHQPGLGIAAGNELEGLGDGVATDQFGLQR